MEKLKNFFSNYKSDILNVLGVVALIAVVVVGAVLFFGKDEAQPNIVEDTTVAATTATTEAETTTTEPETTTVPETTTKAAVTTTKAPVTTTKASPKPTEAPTKAPSNNKPSNTEEGTLPAGLNENHTPGDGIYEMNVDAYNGDANIMAAYNDALSRGVKPTRIYYKNGKYDDVIYTGWDMPYDEIVLCKRCGKPTGHGTHGTCTTFLHDVTCPMCGASVKGGTCHSCKY